MAISFLNRRLDGSAGNAEVPVSLDDPIPIQTSIRYQTLTTTPLVANAVFTSATFDIGVSPADKSVLRVTAYADQTGTVAMDESDDGVTWYQKSTAPISATSFFQTSINNCGRYQRVRVTNGAADQTKFRLAIAY